MFCVSTLSTRKQSKRIYVHVYYNAQTAVADYESFLSKMHQWEEELKHGPLEKNREYYETYFITQETPKRGLRIEYNQEAIESYKKNTSGYLVLLSNDIKDPVRALDVYRDKDVVEKTFDNLKNT